eukprot:CAMPEP_0178464858 /NCGR_PEP_ID=MMETSP0689_2-20121128/51055_1 /TAXON_ID=160604 /ORGANISM="Amphidinium massartii, Strain CS-259" /LENGTH=669 /DNA_ID=CAMNT_0020091765 /DNA_START=9 /DNA_END=2016 /DNA_ORIENTATION=+
MGAMVKGDPLIKKIQVILANYEHLDKIVREAFVMSHGVRENRAETRMMYRSGSPRRPLRELDTDDGTPLLSRKAWNVQSAASLSTLLPSALPEGELAITLRATQDLVASTVTLLGLPCDTLSLQAWVIEACGAFAVARGEDEPIDCKRARWVVDSVLRALAEARLKASPVDFYNRCFLRQLGGKTKFSEAELTLRGDAVAGSFGSFYPHACRKLEDGENSNASGSESVDCLVYLVPKILCRIPPELLCLELSRLMKREAIPNILPLTAAFEDEAHLYLVYDALASDSQSLASAVSLRISNQSEAADGCFSEIEVRSVVRSLVKTTMHAHAQGLVHGSISPSCCFMAYDGQGSSDENARLEILEFGLYRLFNLSPAQVPLTSMDLALIDTSPSEAQVMPPYGRDLRCIAEMAHLMLGGKPLYPIGSSSTERRQRCQHGTVSFAEDIYQNASETAKSLVLDLMRPRKYKGRKPRTLPCQEASSLMSHAWFADGAARKDEAVVKDVIADVVQNFKQWSHAAQAEAMLLRILADQASVPTIERLADELGAIADESCKVPWSELLKVVHQDISTELTPSYALHVNDLVGQATAWRKMRIHDLLWQVFRKAGQLHGVMPTADFAAGLQEAADPQWSNLTRIVDILFPLTGTSSQSTDVSDRKVLHLLGKDTVVRF